MYDGMINKEGVSVPAGSAQQVSGHPTDPTVSCFHVCPELDFNSRDYSSQGAFLTGNLSHITSSPALFTPGFQLGLMGNAKVMNERYSVK